MTAYCAVSATPKVCKPKATDGTPCTSKDECVSQACTAGACGVGGGDAGTDAGKPGAPSDGGAATPDSGTATGGLDAGAPPAVQGEDESAGGGGCGCKTTASPAGTAWPAILFLGSVVGLARRRRR